MPDKRRLDGVRFSYFLYLQADFAWLRTDEKCLTGCGINGPVVRGCR